MVAATDIQLGLSRIECTCCVMVANMRINVCSKKKREATGLSSALDVDQFFVNPTCNARDSSLVGQSQSLC